MAKMRIFSVSSILVSILKSDPPQLSINVFGLATTAGWSAPELRTVEKELSPDGILDLEFVAEPPKGVTPQVISPIMASLLWTKDVKRVIAVRVISRTNDPIQFLRNDQDDLTTFAVGEEGPGPNLPGFPGGPFTTLAIGEEWPTTPPVGEESPFPFPTSPVVGEEGPDDTLPFGEDGWPPRTQMGKSAMGESQNPFTTFGGRNPFSRR